MPTPTSMPAAASFSIALSRCRGCAVPGSVLRHTSSSSVGMLNVMWTSARRASRVNTSMSRTIIGPRVIIEVGFEKSPSTSRHCLVSR